MVPGSHRRGEAYAEEVHETIATSGSNRTEENWGIPGTDVPAVVLEVQPGDLIAFNHRIKHASFGGGTSRRMFTINLQQRFRDEDEELLRECVASLAGFWYARVYAPLMVETAGPERMRHLEQRLAHADHLPDLVAKARQKMAEPNRF